MIGPDDVMTRIAQAIELRQTGHREHARQLLAEVWGEVDPEGDHFYRCALAHSMADVQDDAQEELVWDLRALRAAELITDERASKGGVAGPVAGLYPSLHLNLGEVYRKLGDVEAAHRHLDCGRAAAGSLPDDAYGAMVKRGLEALAGRLSADCDATTHARETSRRGQFLT